ncbi:hypothetical protein N431DRAFT_402497 [Stipitochalara longipes BDJ]|nr:hypothetical protein N431DRAFT_402497 [Stipitochalara longipes BDJ]
MDPVSIVGLVCAIVSAFTGAASLFKERKARKRGRTEKEKSAAALQKSLEIAPPQVQREYDDDFSRIGERFATGDDIGRNQLSTILIDLQSKMISTLQALLNGGSGSYSSLLSTSDNSRLATISALSAQFQRLSQEAPIQCSIPAITTRSCALWGDTDQGVFTMAVGVQEQGGAIYKTIEKGRHCKVLNEADESTVWVQISRLTDLFKVPKYGLCRMRHFWADTDQGILNNSCTAFRSGPKKKKKFLFKKGRACTVFDIYQKNPSYVVVKFRFTSPEWDSNIGYAVLKKYLSPVYPGGRRSTPTSVYVA